MPLGMNKGSKEEPEDKQPEDKQPAVVPDAGTQDRVAAGAGVQEQEPDVLGSAPEEAVKDDLEVPVTDDGAENKRPGPTEMEEHFQKQWSAYIADRDRNELLAKTGGTTSEAKISSSGVSIGNKAINVTVAAGDGPNPGEEDKVYSPDKQDTTDRVLDNVVDVGVSQDDCNCPGDKPGSNQGGSTMPVPAEIHEQNLARLAGAGAQAHEHFVQFGKILDLSYEQDRKMVSLVESLGVREVTSQAGQTGIPLAGGVYPKA